MKQTKSIKLVIADDHIIMREGLANSLSSEPDMEVIAEASNGREAIFLVQQRQPDIALLDIAMDDMTGLEAARHILAELPQVKVIFLTMYEDSEFFFEALRSGASGYVLKGSRTGELLEAIRAVYKGGVSLSPKLAKELVNEYLNLPPRPNVCDQLTDREKEVLVLIARGLSNRAVAEQLEVSINTIKTHRLNIYQKLNIRGHASLLEYALSRGLLGPVNTSRPN